MPGLSRRALLVGAGGATAAVAVGGAVAGPRAWDRLTRDCGGDPASPPASAAPVERGELRSRHVPDPVGWAVALPAGGAPAGALVLVLPGRGGRASQAVDVLRLQDHAAAAALPLAFAAADAGETYWHPRGSGEDRMTMLVDELVPLVAERFDVAADRVPVGLLGWSMGGYGALLAGCERRLPVRAVAVSAPALWTSAAAQRSAVADAFDDAEDYAAHDVFARAGELRDVAARVDCGESDPFADATRAFRARLPEPPDGAMAAGCHDDRFWRRLAPPQVAFLGEQLL